MAAVERGAGEEATREAIRDPRRAQTIDRCSKALLRGYWVLWGRGHVGTAETEVVERDVEKPPLCHHPLERLLCPSQDLLCLSLGQEKVVVVVTLDGVEEGEFRLPLGLHAFGFGEERPGVRHLAELVQRVRVGGPHAQPLERVAALVGIVDGIPSAGLGLGEFSKREIEFA